MATLANWPAPNVPVIADAPVAARFAAGVAALPAEAGPGLRYAPEPLNARTRKQERVPLVSPSTVWPRADAPPGTSLQAP